MCINFIHVSGSYPSQIFYQIKSNLVQMKSIHLNMNNYCAHSVLQFGIPFYVSIHLSHFAKHEYVTPTKKAVRVKHAFARENEMYKLEYGFSRYSRSQTGVSVCSLEFDEMYFECCLFFFDT